MTGRGAAAVVVLAAMASLAWPAEGAAQVVDGDASVRVWTFAAGSLREGPSGFGFARDVVSYSLRVSLPRGADVQPWVQAGWFERPDLECPAGAVCNLDGWTARAGVILPFSTDDTRPGLHSYLVGGIVMAFATEDELSWLLGLGMTLTVTPSFAPAVELHWDQLPGIRNVLMINLGARISLF